MVSIRSTWHSYYFDGSGLENLCSIITLFSLETTEFGEKAIFILISDVCQMSLFYPSVWLATENSLDWFPGERSVFTESKNMVANAALYTFYQGLDNGAGLAVRLLLNPAESWRLAVAVKWEKELFFIFNDGETRSVPFDQLNGIAIEFVCAKPSVPQHVGFADTSELNNVVILSHGFSPASGPGYRFARSVESFIRGLGTWHVVMPDYRATYQFETRHGHSERIASAVVGGSSCRSTFF